jgi:hypothetical protein
MRRESRNGPSFAKMVAIFVEAADTPTQAAGAGFTLIATKNNSGGSVVDTTVSAEYQVVSSAQASVSATISVNASVWAMGVTAFQQASGAAACPHTLTLMGVGC